MQLGKKFNKNIYRNGESRATQMLRRLLFAPINSCKRPTFCLAAEFGRHPGRDRQRVGRSDLILILRYTSIKKPAGQSDDYIPNRNFHLLKHPSVLIMQGQLTQ